MTFRSVFAIFGNAPYKAESGSSFVKKVVFLPVLPNALPIGMGDFLKLFSFKKAHHTVRRAGVGSRGSARFAHRSPHCMVGFCFIYAKTRSESPPHNAESGVGFTGGKPPRFFWFTQKKKFGKPTIQGGEQGRVLREANNMRLIWAR